MYEQKLVKLLNESFKKNEIKGIAYRLKQAKFCGQICDILVDSPHKNFYLAIECKTTKYGLFFSSNFSNGQVESISQFIEQSGRNGYLALLDRKQNYLVPWIVVKELHKEGKKGLNQTILEPYKVSYNLTDPINFIKALNENRTHDLLFTKETFYH